MTSRSCRAHLLTGVAFFMVLLVAGYFFFVQTKVGQAFDNVAYFGHSGVDRVALHYDSDLLGEVNVRMLLLVAGVLFLIALFRKRWLVGLAVIGGLACAVVGAELLKRNLPRTELAAPSGSVPTYFHQDTYPSGHMTVGTSVVLAFLLLAPARSRRWLGGVAGFVSASYATAVLFEGWHRPSDALGGILWSGFCLGLVALVLLVIRKNAAPPAPVSRGALAFSIALGGVALLLALFNGGALSPEQGLLNVPFLVMTASIVILAFVVMGWFGWVLSADGAL